MIKIFSFIILTRNNPDYLKKCLNHLDDQTCTFWKAYVVDTSDKKNVNLNEVECSKYAENVTHISNIPEIGFAEKNNTIIKHILSDKKIEFICLLNDDAYINKDFVKDMEWYAYKYPTFSAFSPLYMYNINKIQVVGGGYFTDKSPCGEEQLLHNLYINSLNDKEKQEVYNIINTPTKIDFGYGAAIVYRTNLFEKVGYLDPVFRHGFDEPDFAKRMELKGEKILYTPTIVTHVCGGSSKNKSFFKNLHIILPMNRAHLYFLLKHYPLKFVFKKELNRLQEKVLHPKGLLIEIYCIIWNLLRIKSTRQKYKSLHL